MATLLGTTNIMEVFFFNVRWSEPNCIRRRHSSILLRVVVYYYFQVPVWSACRPCTNIPNLSPSQRRTRQLPLAPLFSPASGLASPATPRPWIGDIPDLICLFSLATNPNFRPLFVATNRLSSMDAVIHPVWEFTCWVVLVPTVYLPRWIWGKYSLHAGAFQF
jgi:hypothetical protein